MLLVFACVFYSSAGARNLLSVSICGDVHCNLDGATLTMCGPGSISSTCVDRVVTGQVRVEHLITEESILEIGANAFEYFSYLVDVALSDGLVSIGTYAFRSCSALPAIHLPTKQFVVLFAHYGLLLIRGRIICHI
jgi:hypothetical protein